MCRIKHLKKNVECDLEDVVKSLTKNKKTKNEVEIMTSRKVAVIKFNGVEEAVEQRAANKAAEKARKVLEKVRKNMPYYTGMAFEAEINEFEKAGLTSWIKSLISEMEEYL